MRDRRRSQAFKTSLWAITLPLCGRPSRAVLFTVRALARLAKLTLYLLHELSVGVYLYLIDLGVSQTWELDASLSRIHDFKFTCIVRTRVEQKPWDLIHILRTWLNWNRQVRVIIIVWAIVKHGCNDLWCWLILIIKWTEIAYPSTTAKMRTYMPWAARIAVSHHYTLWVNVISLRKYVNRYVRIHLPIYNYPVTTYWRLKIKLDIFIIRWLTYYFVTFLCRRWLGSLKSFRHKLFN